jgi:hypothetical protein
MYLLKGILGLRNAKVHCNVLFKDVGRTHEYLALASLLMRLLEIAPPGRWEGKIHEPKILGVLKAQHAAMLDFG